MPKTRKSHPPSLKAKVAVEAIRAHKTAAQIAQMFDVHPTQVGGWKKQALAGLPDVFSNGREQMREQADAEKDELYKQTGQMKVELDFLKKEPAFRAEDRGPASMDRSTTRAPEHRTTVRTARVATVHVLLRTVAGERREPAPAPTARRVVYGVPVLRQPPNGGHAGGKRKRIQRLMRILGIEALYPKPNLSRPASGHEIYPYLLRDVPIIRPNQVWSTDITYIPMHGGFLYLVAVIDWFSRFVLSWELSNTMEISFCLGAQEAAFRFGQPDIRNNDQGSQFTAADFPAPLKRRGISISMDGRGRALDNVFIERLWRSLKYELIYPGDFTDGRQLLAALERYFHFYNHQRPHPALGYKTPADLFPHRSTRKRTCS
jgi:putative transposase